MRVLVTGATGFIGRRLVSALVARHDVLAASRSGEGVAGARGVALDLTGPATFGALPSRVDVVIHLAAAIEAPSFERYLAVNVLGTRLLLEYAERAGAGLFVHGSTGGVYGSSPEVCREADTLRPQDDYAISKAQAELCVTSFPGAARKVVLRYCAPYEVGTPNPISRIVASVVTGREVEVVPTMSPRYNPLHVDDAVEMTLRAMRLEQNAVLNVAGEEVVTFAGIALIAGEAIGRPPRFRLVDLSETIPYWRSDAVLENTQAYSLLDYRPRIPLRSGISAMARHLASSLGDAADEERNAAG